MRLLLRPRPSSVTAAGLLAVLVSLAGMGAGMSPAAAAMEPDYGTRAAVTFGGNEHAELPVTLDLPAPADGNPITAVSVSWQEQVPQVDPQETDGLYTTTVARTGLDTSACTTGSSCQLQAVIPTARMSDGVRSVGFTVMDSNGTVGIFSRTVDVDNPKPTVTLTSPANHTVWGTVTLAADAAPSTDPGAAPLAGVRFYIGDSYSPDAPYLFDSTPPYSVTVPATDIAPVLESTHIVAVAQDTDGNLSQIAASGPTPAVHWVTVGPPPIVSWTTPAKPGAVVGSVSSGATVDFHAELPGSVPTNPDLASGPYIFSVELLLDGKELAYTPYGEATSWNNEQPGTRLRSIDGWFDVNRADGLTGGTHTITVRVTTGYGSVAESSTKILVADGVAWTGPVTSGGHVVRNGFIVTAGTVHSFNVPVSTKVPGTHLTWAYMTLGRHDLLFDSSGLCPTMSGTRCPSSTVLHGEAWGAPNRPGTRTLKIYARTDGDPTEYVLTRTIVIQPAARLTVSVPTHRVSRGQRVTLTGRLTRRDNGEPQHGRAVLVQRISPDGRWHTLAAGTTNANGAIRLHIQPTTTGIYRLRSPQVHGTIGPGVSRDLTIQVVS